MKKESTKTNENDCRKKEKVAYITGMYGQNMVFGILSTGLTYYYQSVIFLPALAISIISLISRFIDAAKDPFMGSIVDSTRTKYGKCRPYLIITPAILFIITLGVFVNGIYSEANPLWKNITIIFSAAITFILWSFVYGAGDIALTALPTLMTGKEKERNKLIANSRIAASLGIGLIGIIITPLAAVFSKYFTGKTGDVSIGMQYGFFTVVAVFALIGCALLLATGIFSKERITSEQNAKVRMREVFSIMLKCKPNRKLMLSGLLRAPFSIFSIVQLTIFIYYFGNNGATPYIQYIIAVQAFAFIGQIIAVIITPKLAERTDKKKLFIIINVFTAICCISILILYLCVPHSLSNTIPFIIFVFINGLVGLFSGGISVLQPIMIIDCINYNEKCTGQRTEAIFFSGYTMIIKLSYGIAVLIIGIVYAIVGFSGDGVRIVNESLYYGAVFKTDESFSMYAFTMFFLMSVPTALGLLLSIFPLRKYNTDYSKIEICNAGVKDKISEI